MKKNSATPLMRQSQLLDTLKRVGNNLVALYGKRCEIAIHDFADLDASLIYLRGNVTGRKEGAPVSTRLFLLLKQYGDAVADSVNYRMRIKGGRIIRASTTFIRDDHGIVIGCFCTNYDVTDMLNMRDLLNELDSFEEQQAPIAEAKEKSPMEVIDTIVMQASSSIGKQPAFMTKQDRLIIIRMLERNGVFHMKNAVEYVAAVLGVTRFTIYNYLKEINLIRSD